jgi:beta-glucosidase
VEFPISKEDLSFFDAAAHRWTAEPGKFIARVGSASDDIRTSVEFNLR